MYTEPEPMHMEPESMEAPTEPVSVSMQQEDSLPDFPSLLSDLNVICTDDIERLASVPVSDLMDSNYLPSNLTMNQYEMDDFVQQLVYNWISLSLHEIIPIFLLILDKTSFLDCEIKDKYGIMYSMFLFTSIWYKHSHQVQAYDRYKHMIQRW